MRRNGDPDVFESDEPATKFETAQEAAIKEAVKEAVKEVKKEEKKRGRKPSGEKKVVEKGEPTNLGSVEKKGKMPADCYKTTMGRGFCAYSPSKKMRYKLTDGAPIHLGRHEGSKNSETPAAAQHRTGGKADTLDQIRKLLGVSAGTHGHLPGIKIEVVGASKPKKPAKKPETALAKNDEAAATEAAAKKAKKDAQTRNLGPYQFTLLKNPVTDFEVAGIKVVPAGLGAVTAAFISAAVKKVPQVAEMKEGALKKVAPSAGVLAAAVAAHWYATKHNNQFAARVASDAAAFGIAFGINALINDWVSETVDTIAEKISGKPEQKALPAATAPVPTDPTATTQKGGRFSSSMSGGAFGRVNLPSLDGYVGRAPGYPQAQLAGGSVGYPPASLGSGADSAAQMAHLMGGRFSESMGGIDLNGLRD